MLQVQQQPAQPGTAPAPPGMCSQQLQDLTYSDLLLQTILELTIFQDQLQVLNSSNNTYCSSSYGCSNYRCNVTQHRNIMETSWFYSRGNACHTLLRCVLPSITVALGFLSCFILLIFKTVYFMIMMYQWKCVTQCVYVCSITHLACFCRAFMAFLVNFFVYLSAHLEEVAAKFYMMHYRPL